MVSVGQRFGKWTVVGLELPQSSNARAICVCSCGTTPARPVQIGSLMNGGSSSCGCSRAGIIRKQRSGMLVDLVGRRFGSLLVTKLAPKRGTRTRWECRCDCGSTRAYLAGNLANGSATSCGCRKRNRDKTDALLAARGVRMAERERRREQKRAEAARRAIRVSERCRIAARHQPTKRSWEEMCRRCGVTTCKDYPDYGGRGIRVCERWLESFDSFLADMGERPAGRTLDRINNDGNYEPGNCRWATVTEQNRNSRHCKLTRELVVSIIEALAGGASLRVLARRYGVTDGMIWAIKKGRAWRDVPRI